MFKGDGILIRLGVALLRVETGVSTGLDLYALADLDLDADVDVDADVTESLLIRGGIIKVGPYLSFFNS